MKSTKDQATRILDDFQHFDGRRIRIKDGNVGEYPVVIVIPFEESLNEKCRLDIYDRMKSQKQLIRIYDLGDIPYTIHVFFKDFVPKDTLGKYTDFEKWLNAIDIDFDRSKYGIK